MEICRVYAFVLLFSMASPGWNAPRGGADEIRFQRDIRPILANHCYDCHGADDDRRQAGLRLDMRHHAISGLPSGNRAVVPGRPERSALVSRVGSTDPDQKMPPATESVLAPRQIDLLRRWITQGAPYREHWAFTPPRRPPIPVIEETDWMQNPVDAFVLSRLREQDLRPNPRAPRRQRLRRLSLVLRGFPPTRTEVELDGLDEVAVSRAIERWLASPHFGERMAQNWLDAARYADTAGHAADQPRTMWLFRDWVIDAINRDMPFDAFSIDQLAGDLLPEAAENQLIATGFHRNSMQALGNNPRKEEFRVKGVVDRLETTGRVWLGLSLACAECHDHKYDPISTREYYQVFAIFNNIPHLGEKFNVHGPRLEVQLPQTRWALETLRQRLDETDRRRQVLISADAFQARLKETTAQSRNRDAVPGRDILVQLAPLPSGALTATALEKSARHFVGTPLFPDLPAAAPLRGALTVSAWIKTDNAVADLVSCNDWQAGQRSFVVGIGGEGDKDAVPGTLYTWLSKETAPFSGITVYGSRRVDDGKWHHVVMSYRPGESVRLFVDGQLDRQARSNGKAPPGLAKSERRLVIGAGYSNSRAPNAFQFHGQLADLRITAAAVSEAAAVGFAPTRAMLTAELLGRSAEGRAVLAQQRDLEQRRVQLGTRVTAQIMRELPQPRPTYIHIRGDFESPGDQVQPGVPAFLSRSSAQPVTDRLAFARWLVSERNPLTARVAVNRIWQHYFGTGLVRTADDFGIRGAAPSHPGLLDWLAVEFVESGWSVKHIHRLILNSATFQQTSLATPEQRSRDAQNRWLGRFPRRRASAEVIRDTHLAISGLLDRRLGGRSVYPYQPDGVGEYRDATAGKWRPDAAPHCFRRGLYVFWQRTAPYPSMTLFDATSRERCTVRRSTTNTPLQALALLNDPASVEMARAFARRTQRRSGAEEPKSRLEVMFQLALNRAPTSEECARCMLFVTQAVAAGQTEQTAWFHLAGALMNLDETISIE